jgi:drug/metabolite transporter (DMT)-like permease
MLTAADAVNTVRRVPAKYLAICGLAGISQGLGVASLFQALSRAPVTVVSPINASGPLITLLLVHLFLQRVESITPRLILGTFLSVAGVIVVILGAVAE